MIRLITILLLLATPALAQEPIDLMLERDITASPEEDKVPASKHDEITLSALRDISSKLDSISGHLAPDGQRNALREKIDLRTIAIDEADLVQQTRMAFGTEAMAYSGIGALLISVWGIWLLYKNLKEARNATKAAQAAATAAEKQVQQNRAYMILDIESIEFIWRANHKTWVLSQRWENCGQSPAINVSLRYNIHVDKDGAPLPKDFTSPVLPGTFDNWTVGPGQSYSGGPATLLRDDLFDQQPSTGVFIYLECLYSDVHGRTFKNRFFMQGSVCVLNNVAKLGIYWTIPKDNGEIEITSAA